MTDPSAPNEAPPGFILEQDRRLSESLLWGLQRQFFEQQGVRAWSTGTVPHRATDNPFIAAAYAQVVFDWLRDWARSASTPSALDPAQPIYLIELGAGAGRLVAPQ
jgi:hypothetical protein